MASAFPPNFFYFYSTNTFHFIKTDENAFNSFERKILRRILSVHISYYLYYCIPDFKFFFNLGSSHFSNFISTTDENSFNSFERKILTHSHNSSLHHCNSDFCFLSGGGVPPISLILFHQHFSFNKKTYENAFNSFKRKIFRRILGTVNESRV